MGAVPRCDPRLIVGQAKDGDEGAWGELVAPVYHELLRVTLRDEAVFDRAVDPGGRFSVSRPPVWRAVPERGNRGFPP
jgi:hypothetical protein